MISWFVFCKIEQPYFTKSFLQMCSVHPCYQALRKPPTELGSWGRTKARLKSLIIVTYYRSALATEYCFAFGGRLILPSNSKSVHSHLQAELRGSNVNALHCPDDAISSQAWPHLWSESKSLVTINTNIDIIMEGNANASNVNALHCLDEAIFSQAWLHLWSESKS